MVLAAKRQYKTPKEALELLEKAILLGFRLSDQLYQQVKETLSEIDSAELKISNATPSDSFMLTNVNNSTFFNFN